MHILHIITKADLGGAQNVAFNLIQHFKIELGNQLTLVTGEQGPLVENCKKLGVDVIVINTLRRNISLFNDYQAYKQLKKIISDKKADIVQIHSSKAGIIGRLATRSLKVKSIFTVHGWSFKRNPDSLISKCFIVLERYFAKFTDNLVVVSEDDQALAKKYNISAKNGITLIKNGIEETQYLAKPGSANNKVVIVMVARFSEQKDHGTFLEAIKSINKNVEIWLIGDGPNIGTIKQRINNENLSDVITQVGPSEQVEQLLAQAHIGVLCSNWEGLPISIIEYMRAGLPVIATDVGGVCELIKHNKNGLIIQPKDVVSLTSGLESLIDNPDIRQKLGQLNREDFKAKFSANAMFDRYQQTYENILTSDKASNF